MCDNQLDFNIRDKYLQRQVEAAVRELEAVPGGSPELEESVQQLKLEREIHALTYQVATFDPTDASHGPNAFALLSQQLSGLMKAKYALSLPLLPPVSEMREHGLRDVTMDDLIFMDEPYYSFD